MDGALVWLKDMEKQNEKGIMSDSKHKHLVEQCLLEWNKRQLDSDLASSLQTGKQGEAKAGNRGDDTQAGGSQKCVGASQNLLSTILYSRTK